MVLGLQDAGPCQLALLSSCCMRCILHANAVHVHFGCSSRALLGGTLLFTQSRDVSGARADYEVDFITFFTRLTGTKMGAKFDDEAYLVPIKIDIPRL